MGFQIVGSASVDILWAFVLPFESDVTIVVVFSAVQVSLEVLKRNKKPP